MESIVQEVRTKIEHQMLPFIFYTDSINFLMSLQNKQKNIIFENFKFLCEKNETDMPYKESEFKVLFNRNYNGIYITCIEMPKPTQLYDCKRIYLTFSEDLEDMLYITIEPSEEKNINQMCAWLDNGSHIEFEKIEDNINIEFEKVILFYNNEK